MISALRQALVSAHHWLPTATLFEHHRQVARMRKIYQKFRKNTMIPELYYIDNLMVAASLREVPGCVVECGVWRGGMSGGLAAVMGIEREYFLFDSFEGLPAAKSIDGPAAQAWQADVNSPGFCENCKASVEDADLSMRLSGARRYRLVKGWFEQTLPSFEPSQAIALLRLDADWYESVRTCLQYLYPYVSPQGLIIVDDYYAWDGCARAVHEFLAECKDPLRIVQIRNRVCVLVRGRPTARWLSLC